MKWHNWTGDQVCHPSEFVAPRSKDELAAALARAARSGWTVRGVGAGHSFSEAVPTDGMIVSLRHMDRVVEVDRMSGLVRVQAGIPLHRLNLELDRYGLALENLGDIDAQSIAGAISTGTHGTGAKLRNLSSNVLALEVMRADGSTVEVDELSDIDAWRAARVGLGALGIITEVTLRTVEAFVLHAVDAPDRLDDVLGTLDERVDGNDHFEFYTFPSSPIVQTRTNNRSASAPRPPSPVKKWIESELLENFAFGVTRRVGRRVPATMQPFNKLAASVWGKTETIDKSFAVFATKRRVRFTEMEYAVPRENAVEAVRGVREIADRRDLNVSFPIEVRFQGGDDAFLSPTAGRDTCHISVHVYQGMEWEPYFRAVESLMDGLGGRPHWGKRHLQSAETLAPRYAGWERFRAVRERFDPQRRFTNDYVRRVLGD